jgi:hypothetical protein
MVIAVLLVVVGPVDRPDHEHYAPTVKQEAVTAVVVLLMIDVRKPETC